MTNKFEDMPTDVRESILRTIEHRLSRGDMDYDSKHVDSVMAAYCRLFQENVTTSVGEIVVNITTVFEKK